MRKNEKRMKQSPKGLQKHTKNRKYVNKSKLFRLYEQYSNSVVLTRLLSNDFKLQSSVTTDRKRSNIQVIVTNIIIILLFMNVTSYYYSN